MQQGFRILLQDSLGKKRTAEFSTEDETVQFLKDTYRTEAPLLFEYLDGSHVDGRMIDQIYKRVFQS